jgi:hypothetical protein
LRHELIKNMDYTIENKVFDRMKKAKRGVVFFTMDCGVIKKRCL